MMELLKEAPHFSQILSTNRSNHAKNKTISTPTPPCKRRWRLTRPISARSIVSMGSLLWAVLGKATTPHLAVVAANIVRPPPTLRPSSSPYVALVTGKRVCQIRKFTSSPNPDRFDSPFGKSSSKCVCNAFERGSNTTKTVAPHASSKSEVELAT